MTYCDLITSRLADKPYSEVLDLACRLEAKWVLLDGEIGLDTLADMIKNGIGGYEALEREELLTQLSERYENVMEIFENDLLTITDFLAGNWE